MFRTVLGSEKLRGRYRDFPYMPYPNTCKVLPHYQHPSPDGTFVAIDELMVTGHHHPEFTLGFTPGVVRSMSLGKWIMMCFCHCGITQSSFTALKTPYAPSVHSSSLSPGNHSSFYCLHSFAFPRMS